MIRSEKRTQLLIAIQKFAKEEGHSGSDLYRIVSERGCEVSESTIRRIVKADPEKENFNYEILHSVTRALFAVNAAPLPVEEIETPEEAEREALRAVAALSDVELQDTVKELDETAHRAAHFKREYEKALETIAELKKIADFRKEQMQAKDAQIDRLLRLLERK